MVECTYSTMKERVYNFSFLENLRLVKVDK